MHRLIARLSLCHLLVAASLVAFYTGHPRLVGLFCLCVGLGGLGACWGRHTAVADDWLHVGSAWHRPERLVLKQTATHVPFAVIGIALLRTRNVHASS